MTDSDLIEARAQLEKLVRDLYQRARILFGRPPAGVSVHYIARDLASRLIDLDHPAVGPAAAREVATTLIFQVDSETFWRSQLGQLVAWHIGYPEEMVPIKLVGALLGTTRQNGYLACAQAGMRKTLDGSWLHVPTAEVLDLIRERRPLPWKA